MVGCRHFSLRTGILPEEASPPAGEVVPNLRRTSGESRFTTVPSTPSERNSYTGVSRMPRYLARVAVHADGFRPLLNRSYRPKYAMTTYEPRLRGDVWDPTSSYT